MYDIIIIGGGISGLYAAYKIKKHAPETRFLILEKNPRSGLGGRANNVPFQGSMVAIGAGIGRKRDKLLRRLVSELGFEINEFSAKPAFSEKIKQPLDIRKALTFLRGEYQKRAPTNQTFSQFAKHAFGLSTYKQFSISSGYTDYEKAGTYETLYYYDMEDNAGVSGFSVSWHQLVEKLASNIGESHFRFLTEVSKLSSQDDHYSDSQSRVIKSANMKEFTNAYYLLETERGAKYACKKIIVATTIDSIRHLLPRPIYKNIEGQPFLRVYGKFTAKSASIMKEYVKGTVIVPGPLQKIIAIHPETGVYMIAYSDNRQALDLKSHTENTSKTRALYCHLLETALGMDAGLMHLVAIRSFYWDIGTHYYKPLDHSRFGSRKEFIEEAQHPADGILVVGEVVGVHQGWTEGALESVEAVLTKKWLNV